MAKCNRRDFLFLDYLIDGKSHAEKIFRRRKLKYRIRWRTGIKGYPNRHLVLVNFSEKDSDLFESCFEQLCEDTPKEVLEDGLTLQFVMREHLVMNSTETC